MLANCEMATCEVVLILPVLQSAGAERIVHGKVIATETYWLGGRIVTDAKVLVEKTMKGDAEKIVVVRRLGGVVDGIGQKTWGSASLDLGEEVFLFLEHRNQSGVLHPVGMAQGKFSVMKTAGGEKRVVRLNLPVVDAHLGQAGHHD